MTTDDEGRSASPIRLCCGQRHDGPVCPDDKVMCCLCFERVPAEGLTEDVCRPCAEREAGRTPTPDDGDKHFIPGEVIVLPQGSGDPDHIPMGYRLLVTCSCGSDHIGTNGG